MDRHRTLHRETGNSEPYPTDNIVNYVSQKKLTNGAYKSIWQHVNQHCVANRKPQPNRARMLFATAGGNRRLFRNGDRYDPAREGAPTHPHWDKLPPQYRDLRRWYEEEWNAVAQTDPLLDLIGSGTVIWRHEDADGYVSSLRKNWGDTH